MPKGVYARRRRPLAARLFEKVDRNGPIPEHCPELGKCHVWTGAVNPGGYGKIASETRGKTVDVHRAAWTLEHGEIPEGMSVLHRCDNPPCVRGSHLFLGDHQANMDDQARKARQPSGARNGMAKLSEGDALLILQNPSEQTGVALARRFRVSPSIVCNIRKGKGWRHLLPS